MSKARPPASVPARARAQAWNASDLARLLGASRETLRQWTLAGCPRLDTGDYIVSEVVTWLRKRERDAAIAEGKQQSQQPKTELNRKLAAEAELKELQLERERGLVIEVEDAEERIARVVGGFAAVAAGRLARFEREIVRCTTAADARKLTDRIRVALMEGAHDLAQELDGEAVLDEAGAA